MAYELLRVSRHGQVGLIALDRPEALNALSLALREELRLALLELEQDEAIGALVITGSEKVFAAGADVKAISEWDYTDVTQSTQLRAAWEQLCKSSKPVIAAVAGLALGAGCELAMMCDFIMAADNARFGQPEIRLGTIPGSGGTQRLVRLIGKSKAMEMVLTGHMMSAEEAERSGLVARVVPLKGLIDDALKTAASIAALSRPVVRMARDAVNHALDTSLSEGLRYESRLFEATFALDDRREGMRAFIEKRSPVFRHR